MSIKGDIEELKGLNTEIKRLNAQLHKLRLSRKAVEGRIADYFKNKDLPGAKLNDAVILVDNKPKFVYKSPKQKSQAVMDVLREYGLPAQEVMARISEAGRKEVVDSTKIKFKAIKKK